MRIIIIFLIAITFSCSDKKKKESSLNNVNDIKDVISKKVFFKWPKDGSTVASPVFVDMGVEGMIIEPAGIVKEGYGHHHILINQKFGQREKLFRQVILLYILGRDKLMLV